MKTKIEIKSWMTGLRLFEYECGDNTIRKTLEQAISIGANLSYADLRGANLSGADLRYADLCYADLRYADLRGADLQPIRDDFWAVLSSAPNEVMGLRQAIIMGKIDGSTYTGNCTCLVGTIAKVCGKEYEDLPLLKPNSARPAEKFFLNINAGDTPETNQFSKMALEWTDQWLNNMRAAFGGK